MNVVRSEQAWKTGGCPLSAPKPEPRMNFHKNARTTPHSRLQMVRRVLDQKQAAMRVAADFGVSERTVRKWLARWRRAGPQRPELGARSAAPVAARTGHRDRSAASAKPDLARDRPPPRPAALDRRRRPAPASVSAASGASIRPHRWCATNATVQASSSTSTPRSSAGSPASATASPAAAPA
jgi:transposase-like protein